MLLVHVTSGSSTVQPRSTTATPEHAARGGFYFFFTLEIVN